MGGVRLKLNQYQNLRSYWSKISSLNIRLTLNQILIKPNFKFVINQTKKILKQNLNHIIIKSSQSYQFKSLPILIQILIEER